MVEAIANSVEDRLIDGLSFRLNPGASYITDRRSVTYHPQGSNIYKPKSGTKVIRFQLTGDSWLDPSTFRFSFSLRNSRFLNSSKSRKHSEESHPLATTVRVTPSRITLTGGQLSKILQTIFAILFSLHSSFFCYR